ncbi:MAG: hypothetical protein ABI723_08905 [Bacteroidia bacterium]
MSSTVLKIIPTVPSYVPSSVQQNSSKAILTEFYKGNQIEFLSLDTIEFVDQGANFESVSCNVCRQDIPIEDWQNQMDKLYQNQFNDLTFQTPCKHQTSVNDLNYKSPAGFAKFIISISDAQSELPKTSLERLQEILGTPLRIVWAHY